MHKVFNFPIEPFEYDFEEEFEGFDGEVWESELNRNSRDYIWASVDTEANYGAAATQEKVRWYQTILKVAGGFSGLTINGNHNDKETKKALRQFQRFYKLQETGYLETDSNVALTQIALEWIYLTSLPNPKGKLGQSLKDQITQFQNDHGLDPDGKVGALTRERMLKALRMEISSPLRLYHRTLGPVSPTAPPSTGGSCQVYSDGNCVRESPPPHDPAGLIGHDSRVAVPDSELLGIPWRWICLLMVRFDDPDGGAPLTGLGTGVLVSAQHVLTCAHVLLDEIVGSKGTRKKSIAREITAIPACMGLVSSSTRSKFPTAELKDNKGKLVTPFGYHRTSDNALFNSPINWDVSLDYRYDYAVFRLEKPIGFLEVPGKRNQRLGWWGSIAHGAGTVIQPTAKEYLHRKTIIVSGYPGCDPQLNKINRQFRSHGQITEINLGDSTGPAPELIGHEADIRKAQSGGPIWTLSQNNGRNLVAIQSRVGLLETGNCINVGVHLTPSVWQDIESWIG